jgi:hypothetical protein
MPQAFILHNQYTACGYIAPLTGTPLALGTIPIGFVKDSSFVTNFPV